MAEKRKFRRVSLVYFLKVYDLDSEEFVGHLADISLGGLKMIGELHLPPGVDHRFRIYLPEDFSRQSIAVEARSCWSKPDVNPDFYATGFYFIRLSLENFKLIKMLMSRYRLENSTASRFF